MKLKILVLAVAMGAVASSFAQTNPPSVSGARITFDSPEFDFGKVDSGTLVKHEFVFTNTGTQLLEVSGVRPGCGCTTAGDWDKSVEPGKTGKIPVQFNSAGYGGPVNKSITVTCNDSNTPTVYLALKGTVWKLIDVTPVYAVFNIKAEEQSDQTQVVKIINNSDQPVTVSDPTCGNPTFQTELKTVKEGKEFELRVTAILSNVTGNVSAPITLKTTSTKMPQVSLTAFIMRQPLFTLNPFQIMLPAGPLEKSTDSTIMIQNNGTNPVVLSEPMASVEGVEVHLAEQQPGRQFNLKLTFPAGFQQPSGVQVTVKTSNPKNPLITIPVVQFQRPAQTPAANPAAPSHSATSSSKSGAALAQPATTVSAPMGLKK
jgi:hypothetical protein